MAARRAIRTTRPDTARSVRRPPSSLDQRIAECASAFDIDLHWPGSRVAAGGVAVVVILGVRLGGLVGGLAAPLACAAVAYVLHRTALTRRQRRADRHLPEVALRLGRSLRSGQAFETAIAEGTSGDPELSAPLASLQAQLQGGRPALEALSAWVGAARSDAEQLFAAAVAVGFATGGDIAVAIDGVGDGIRDDLQLEARRSALLTQTRLSAAVLVALPIAFAAMASLVQGNIIYRGSVGLLLLVGGLLLDGLGVLWMRRLLRGLR